MTNRNITHSLRDRASRPTLRTGRDPRGWVVTKGKGVGTLRHFRRSPSDEGAAAVEFALLFPIFMVLALGIINGGLAFSRQINVTQAAREASRFGSTYDISGIPGGGTL